MLVHDIFGNTAHAAITLPTINDTQNIGELISDIYDIAIGIVGFAVFIQFIHAGILYLTAAGNAAGTHHAKEIMQNAVIGALLLLSSYLILNVINPDLVKTNVFNFDEITKLFPKIEKYDPRCDIDPAACKTPTNPIEAQLKRLGVDWGVSDVSTLSTGSIRLLGNISANCGCALRMAGLSSSAGGDTFSLSPPGEVYDYIKERGTVITKEDVIIGGDAVIKKTWKDSSGNIFTTYEKDGYLSNTAAAIVVRVPK